MNKIVKILKVAGMIILSIILVFLSIFLIVGGIAEENIVLTFSGIAVFVATIVFDIRYSKKSNPKVQPKQEPATSNIAVSVPNFNEYINKSAKPIRKKTMTCRTCGGEVSPRAKRCPHCGERTPAEIFSQFVIGVVMAPFTVILILFALAFYFGWFSYFLK